MPPTIEDVRQYLVAQSEMIAEAIIDGWRDLGTDEPWLGLPEDIDVDYLPPTLEALANAALRRPSSPQERRELLEAAAEHGADRAEEGMAEELVHRELHLLRGGVWDAVRRRFGDGGAALDAMFRLEAGLTLAVSASLFGYNVGPPASSPEWPGMAERLLARFETS